MCFHELWTYPECGCQVDHHVPCFPPSTNDEERSPHRLSRVAKCSALQTQINSSPVHLSPSPTLTDPEDDEPPESFYKTPTGDRQCSVKHTIKKTFLEPICDDCLLDELGLDRQASNSLPPLDDQGAEMVRGKRCGHDKIADDRPKREHRREASSATILESDVQIQIEDVASEICTSFDQASSIVPRQDSAFSGADADDEGSIIVPRGRPRSKTKDQRRLAMDVSREDLRLRISSQWPSMLQRNMQEFKDTLQGRSTSPPKPESSISNKDTDMTSGLVKINTPKTLLSRFAEAHNGGKSWAKNTVTDLKRTLSKASRKRLKHRGVKGQDHDLENTPTASASAPAVRTLRAVAVESTDSLPQIPAQPQLKPHSSTNHSSTSIASWQDHLSGDLTSRAKDRKSVSQVSQLGYKPQRLVRRTSSVPNWLIPSNPFSDSRRRLLSTSTLNTVSSTVQSGCFTFPEQGKRLASILSDSDFSNSDDQWVYHPSPIPQHLIQYKIGNKTSASSTHVDDSAPSPTIPDTRLSIHHPSTSINAVSQTTPARPKSRLAIHPLTTPFRLSTSNHPELNPRSSSFNSPPISTPMRLSSRVSSQGTRHSPTMGYTCIWERKLCGVCDESGLTEVKTCVCDGIVKMGQEGGSGSMRCRATGPVVRYVEIGNEQVGKECGGLEGCAMCKGRNRVAQMQGDLAGDL